MIRIAREISRFRSKKDIDTVFKNARRVIARPGIHILIAPTLAPFGKVLIIVPRAVGSAPARNKLRRRIRSIFYQETLFKKGLDCIVIFKVGATQLSFTTLRDLLLTAYQKSSNPA